MKIRRYNPTALLLVIILLSAIGYLTYYLSQASIQHRTIIESFKNSNGSDSAGYLDFGQEISINDIAANIKNRVFILSSPSNRLENPFYHIAPQGPFEIRSSQSP